MPKSPKIKVMVSSTVYGFEDKMTKVCATLEGYGYEVLNSHYGTISSVLGANPTDACLKAVEECDFFFGIILPRYGSGITHQEIEKAIQLNKPRRFLVHFHVPLARQLLAQYMYSDEKNRVRRKHFKFKKTSILEDIRVIDMYNDAIQDGKPMAKRIWAQQFIDFDVDGMRHLDAIFADYKKFASNLKTVTP